MKKGIDRVDIIKKYTKNKRVGLVCNSASLNSENIPSLDVISSITNLTVLFALEHGVNLSFLAGEEVKDEKSSSIPIFSLYNNGAVKLSQEALSLIDILIFDVQDLGVRFYTYIASLKNLLLCAKENDLEIIVLDRPNPLGCEVYGTKIKECDESFVGPLGLPIRYGLTIGELALYFNSDINASLRVVELLDYEKTLFKGEWVKTSPNIPSFETAFIYAGTCLFEGTNISEGRGTDKPFLCFGSPFMKENLDFSYPGLRLLRREFTPTSSKYKGILCYGYEIKIDSFDINPIEASLMLINKIFKTYKDAQYLKNSNIAHIDHLLGSRESELLINDLNSLLKICKDEANEFKIESEKYRLY